MKRKLPVLVEGAINKLSYLRADLAETFEKATREGLGYQDRGITCRKGCASCCYHPVLISVLEGISIYQWLENEGLWTASLKKKLKESSDLQYGTTFQTWLLSLIPCPFLGDKDHCTIYPVRPFICRTYFSSGDPYYCHPHRLGPGTEIVDREVPVEKYHLEQKRELSRLKVQFTCVPIGLALLLASRVVSGELTLNDVDRVILKEYSERG